MWYRFLGTENAAVFCLRFIVHIDMLDIHTHSKREMIWRRQGEICIYRVEAIWLHSVTEVSI